MLLQDIAQVIRSKNAGPRRLTLDIMFASDTDYRCVVQSPALSCERIAVLYGVAIEDVAVMPYPLGRAIKITVARLAMAGDPGDRDVAGAQQHAPLLGVENDFLRFDPSPGRSRKARKGRGKFGVSASGRILEDLRRVRRPMRLLGASGQLGYGIPTRLSMLDWRAGRT